MLLLSEFFGMEPIEIAEGVDLIGLLLLGGLIIGFIIICIIIGAIKSALRSAKRKAGRAITGAVTTAIVENRKAKVEKTRIKEENARLQAAEQARIRAEHEQLLREKEIEEKRVIAAKLEAAATLEREKRETAIAAKDSCSSCGAPNTEQGTVCRFCGGALL